MKKRILSIVLALTMLLSLFPVTALAAEPEADQPPTKRLEVSVQYEGADRTTAYVDYKSGSYGISAPCNLIVLMDSSIYAKKNVPLLWPVFEKTLGDDFGSRGKVQLYLQSLLPPDSPLAGVGISNDANALREIQQVVKDAKAEHPSRPTVVY